MTRTVLMAVVLLWPPGAARGQEPAKARADNSTATVEAAHEVRFKIWGLYQESREADLRKAAAEIGGFAVKSVDYETAIAALEIDLQKLPVAQLNNKLRPFQFEIKQQFAAIEVPGLHCKGCAFAAYLAMMRVEGVEQATANHQNDRVTAWFDPTKANKQKIIDALIQRGFVSLKPDAKSPK